jgi:hypothetical protein
MFVNLILISFKIYEIMLHYEIKIHHFDPKFYYHVDVDKIHWIYILLY